MWRINHSNEGFCCENQKWAGISLEAKWSGGTPIISEIHHSLIRVFDCECPKWLSCDILCAIESPEIVVV